MTKLAIFASGFGSNALNIFHFFKGHDAISVEIVVTDNPKAGIITKTVALKIPLEVIPFSKLSDQTEEKILLNILEKYQVDAIVLAGFLKLVPQNLLKKFPDRIVNIHPALLPDFGGKGMYGMRVHEAVITSKMKQSGITIHLVNEHYDKGKILFQKTLAINSNETPESLASRIHELEYRWYPLLIDEWLGQ